MAKAQRPDRIGTQRTAFEKNKKIILATRDTCGICGLPVDFGYKAPHPLSPTVDHIIPVSKGGHPSDMANLQLAHRWCNRWKGDKSGNITFTLQMKENEINNQDLPQHAVWSDYRPG